MENSKKDNKRLDNSKLLNEVKLWEKAEINLIDVRYKILNTGESILDYICPTSLFIYIVGEKVEINLNGEPYRLDRFGVFHMKKGSKFSIVSKVNWTQYYIILYRGSESNTYRKNYMKLLGKSDPFTREYGYLPTNPIFYGSQFCRIYESWIRSDEMGKLSSKVEFYKLIYHIYEDLLDGEIKSFDLDLVSMVKKHMEDNLAENISIQALANSFDVSIGQLNRLFKSELGLSPQNFLKEIRLKEVKNQFLTSNHNLREIAIGTGFYDEFYMSKEFKKNFGESPSSFRRNNTWAREKLSMGSLNDLAYNEKSLVSIWQPIMEGEFYMFKQFKSKLLMATALSLMIFLTACSGTGGNIAKEETNKVAIEQEAFSGQVETRTVKTSLGDVEVPVNPKRIIVDYVIGDVISLGIKPIGVGSVFEGNAFANEISDATILEKWEPEALMALEPDLIISVVEDNLEDFSKIAPTIYVPFTKMSMEERVNLLGEVLNKEDEAKEILKNYDAKIAEAKVILEENGLMDKTISIIFGDPVNVFVAGDKWGRGGDIIYNGLGFKAPEPVQKEIIGGDQYRNLSLEVLPDYVGDYMLYDWEPNEFEKGSIWESIPAYSEGRAIPLDLALFFYNDIYSQSEQLDFIVENLIKLNK